MTPICAVVNHRVLCTATAGVVAVALAAGPASAQLGLPLPGLGRVVQDLGTTVDNLLPTQGVVTTVTGSAGGVLSGVQQTVTGTVGSALDGVLGGSTAQPLPAATLDQLLAALGLTAGPAGQQTADGHGAGTVAAPSGTPLQGGVVDAAAPEPTFTVLTTLRRIHKTGSLKLRVTSNEPGIVAVGGAIRPGAAVKKAGKRKTRAVKHDRRLIKFPAAVLAYRKAGSLTMTIKLGKPARRTLGASRNGRISLAVIAADVYRNQASGYEKRKLKR